MSWARFDDRCPSNPKVALLSDAAFRLWFTAICYSCEHLTDGEIQRDVPAILTRAPSGAKLRACIRELVDRGLWRETENGWEVHDFLDWNPSGEQVRAKREARAKAGRKGGKRSGESRSRGEARPKQLLQQTGSSGESKTNPVPVPVPVPRSADADPPKPPAAASALDPEHFGLQRHPSNFDEALTMPLQARAELALERRDVADWCQAHRWPEVVEAAEVMSAAMGLRGPKLAPGGRDTAVQALLALFAAGFTLDEFREVASRPDDFLRGLRSLAKLSPTVMRRCLDGAPQAEPDAIVWEGG